MTGGEATRREAIVNQLLLVVLLMALPVAFASFGRVFHDGDTSWHLAVGRWMVEHGRIPAVDPFSFTAAGKPWVAMEWLSDLLFTAVFAAAGYAGLSALVAAALMALSWIVFLHLRRFVGPIGITVAIIGMNVVLATFMLARPHVLAWPLLALWTVILARSAESGRSGPKGSDDPSGSVECPRGGPPPLWTALLLVLWTNMHGSFPLAAVIGGCLALDALIAAQWKTLREWLIFAAVCLVAVCLNANGVDGLLQPFRVAQLETLHLIQEWLPSAPGRTPNFYGALLGVVGLLLWKGARVPPGRLLLLLVLLWLAFLQVRHQSWLAIVAAVLVPPLLGARADPVKAAGRQWPLALAAAALLAVRALWPLTPEEGPANPARLFAAIPPELRTQPVFNEYTFGGPLILAGIRPFIDGRSELYGDQYMIDYVDIAAGDTAKFDRAVERYGIRWAILPARGSGLAAELAKSPRWRRIHTDKVGTIFVRTN